MQIFDQAHFSHMTAGDRALQREVVDLFRAQVEGWSTAMSAGQGWREAIHTLKGSARGIGLSALAEACEAAERASNGEVAAAIARTRAALDQALAALEQYAAAAA
jgi:HPt (histidine-containing phosphotransfer) domain-containing protein